MHGLMDTSDNIFGSIRHAYWILGGDIGQYAITWEIVCPSAYASKVRLHWCVCVCVCVCARVCAHMCVALLLVI